MRGNAMTCLTALLCVGCSEPLVLDAGSAGRLIAGVVTDSAARPVAGADVQGFHTHVVGSECDAFPLPGGFRGWDTDENGEYRARISETPHSGGAGQRCLFIEFLPPDGSGLGSVSINGMRVHLYSGHDPAWRADTLFINAVLPVAEAGG